MAFHRGGLVFVFNWSGDRAIMDYTLPAPQKGEWKVVLDTDNARFGGFGRQDGSVHHFTDEEGRLSLYLLPRTALVLKRVGSAVMARPAEPGCVADAVIAALAGERNAPAPFPDSLKMRIGEMADGFAVLQKKGRALS